MSNLKEEIAKKMNENPVVSKQEQEKKLARFGDCVSLCLLDLEERDIDVSELTMEQIIEELRKTFKEKQIDKTVKNRYHEAEEMLMITTKEESVKIIEEMLAELRIEYRKEALNEVEIKEEEQEK